MKRGKGEKEEDAVTDLQYLCYMIVLGLGFSLKITTRDQKKKKGLRNIWGYFMWNIIRVVGLNYCFIC